MTQEILVNGPLITMSIEGLDTVLERLEDMYGDMNEEVLEVTADELGAVLDASREIVPYDTGALHDSGFMNVEETGDGRIEGTVGYNMPYAVYVHERLDVYHEPPTQAKFLEQPWSERKGGIAQTIFRRAVKLMKDGK
jgi:hypothetical protein